MVRFKFPGIDEDYKPSPGELDNLGYIVMKYACGWMMRKADLYVMLRLAGDVRGPQGLNRFLQVAAKYTWDHIMGSPKKPSVDEILRHIRPGVEKWYQQTLPADRAKTDFENN